MLHGDIGGDFDDGEAIRRSKRSRTARDALSCEDGVAGPGGIAAKASAGRELLRTDEVAFCVGALASDGLKVEGTDMQGADSKQANVGSKHMFGDFGLKDPDGCLDDCGCVFQV